jgi:broad specificity polyphosphatase/5'/3'-nucleotidase SurE
MVAGGVGEGDGYGGYRGKLVELLRQKGIRDLAVAEGFISVTPLHMDLTNYSLLETVQGWSLEV